MDGLTTSSNSSKKSFSHTAKGMLGSVSAGLEEDEGPPALEAAAADPRGSFTAAAAEAGGEEEPEPVAADGCANVVGAGKVGSPGTAITGDTVGDSCEEGVDVEGEPEVVISWFSAGSTRSL